jgi:hypothetical protein
MRIDKIEIIQLCAAPTNRRAVNRGDENFREVDKTVLGLGKECKISMRFMQYTHFTQLSARFDLLLYSWPILSWR